MKAPFTVGEVGVRVWCLEDDTGIPDTVWHEDGIKVGEHRVIKEVFYLEERKLWCVRVFGCRYETSSMWHLAKQFAPLPPPIKKSSAVKRALRKEFNA